MSEQNGDKQPPIDQGARRDDGMSSTAFDPFDEAATRALLRKSYSAERENG